MVTIYRHRITADVRANRNKEIELLCALQFIFFKTFTDNNTSQLIFNIDNNISNINYINKRCMVKNYKFYLF
jgi:hypothetical protein